MSALIIFITVCGLGFAYWVWYGLKDGGGGLGFGDVLNNPLPMI